MQWRSRVTWEARRVGGARRTWPRPRGVCVVLRLPPEMCAPARWVDDRSGDWPGDEVPADQQWVESYLRIGEAKNPGPHDVPQQKEGALELRYASQHQDGFWGAMLPDGRMDRGGHDGAAGEDDLARFRLVVDTCNGTSWGTIARYLLQTNADLILIQEHHLAPGQIAAASQWASRKGWQSIWTSAEQGEGSGWRAGVCICARAPVYLSLPRRGGSNVCGARAVAAVAEAPGHRPIAVYSAYLRDGEGLSAGNLGILATLGQHIGLQGEEAPFILAADFQMSPDKIAVAGLADKIGAVICASGNRRGTCRTPQGNNELDYFYVQRGLARAVASIATVEGTCIRTHVPVRLTMKPAVTSARTLVLRKPPPIGVCKVYGPALPPPDWSEVRNRAEELLRSAYHAEYDVVMDKLERLYADWADIAEMELCDVTGESVPKAGLRGRHPCMVWRSVVPERPPKTDGDYADAVRWMALIVVELRRAAHALPRRPGGFALGPCDDRDEHGADADADDDRGGGEHDESVSELLQISDAIEAADVAQNLLGELVEPPEAYAMLRDSDIKDDADAILAAVTEAAGGLVDLLLGFVRTSDDVARRELQAKVDQWDVAVQGLADRASALARDAEGKRLAEAKTAWAEWVRANIDSGARNAHKYLQLPMEWQPTTAVTPDGVITADPVLVLGGYNDKYRRMWESGDADEEFVADTAGWARRCALPRPTPVQIREASVQFREGTSVAYDGFHPRHYALLCDESLEIVGAFMVIIELVGALPRQLRLLLMPLIPKPRSGHRAVASFVSLYRMWAKVRKPAVDAWEAEYDRAYLAAGKGRSPQDLVWRQAVRAETNVEDKGAAGALLWDMKSFYEKLNRRKLRRRLVALQFPLPIARLALAAYSGPRILSLAGCLAEPSHAWRGVAAGCGVANSLIRAYVIPPFDHMVADIHNLLGDNVIFDDYVDDLVLNAVGTEAQVEQTLVEAQVILADVIHHELDCEIEVEKAAVLASSRDLTRRLVRRIGARAGRRRRTAPNLGIDYAPGRRRTAQYGGKRTGRFRGLARKMAPFRRLCRVIGGKASKVFVAGPLPYATYGSVVNGLSDAEVLRIRRCVAVAWSPRARGRSLKMITLLNRAPTHSAENGPIVQYSKEVWRAASLGGAKPKQGEMTLAELSKAWHAVDADQLIDKTSGKAKWGSSRGPIANLVLSLHRVGWHMKGPFELIDDFGSVIPLTSYAPPPLLPRCCTRRPYGPWRGNLATACTRRGTRSSRTAACASTMSRQGYEVIGT